MLPFNFEYIKSILSADHKNMLFISWQKTFSKLIVGNKGSYSSWQLCSLCGWFASSWGNSVFAPSIRNYSPRVCREVKWKSKFNNENFGPGGEYCPTTTGSSCACWKEPSTCGRQSTLSLLYFVDSGEYFVFHLPSFNSSHHLSLLSYPRRATSRSSQR